MFRILGLVKPSLEQSFDFVLRGRPSDRSHARLPAGSDLDVRRRAGGAPKPLRVRTRPLVEGRDAPRQRVDEAVELAVGQQPVYIAISFSQIASEIVGAEERFQGLLCAHLSRQARHRTSASDETYSHFPLRQKSLLAAGETHVAGQ